MCVYVCLCMYVYECVCVHRCQYCVCLTQVLSMLAEPNPESPANVDGEQEGVVVWRVCGSVDGECEHL